MGRLISEDDVMRMLTGVELNNGTITDAKSELRNVKTAYDISKVVAELKEKKDEASIESGKRSVRIGEDEYEDDPYYEGKKHAYGHAIELLRKGAV